MVIKAHASPRQAITRKKQASSHKDNDAKIGLVKNTYNPWIIGGLSALAALWPHAAPIAGLVCGAYVAWNTSTIHKNNLANKSVKTFFGAIASTIAGMVGMMFPLVISSIPVNMAITGTKMTIDAIRDQNSEDDDLQQKKKKQRTQLNIDRWSVFKRLTFAILIGGFPIIGPVLGILLLEQETQSFQHKNQT